MISWFSEGHTLVAELVNESLSIGDDVVHDGVCDSLLSSLSPKHQIWKNELNKPDVH